MGNEHAHVKLEYNAKKKKKKGLTLEVMTQTSIPSRKI